MNRKKIMLTACTLALSAGMCLGLGGCGSTQEDVQAEAPTGTYVGQMNDGIEEYLGIRYGEFESYQAPADVTTTTEDVIEAKEWGKNSLQPYDEVEVASQDPCSQDCLFLNIWTKDNTVKDKPVIFWIHGGGYTQGGSSDPLYDGEQFVRTLPEGEDCVLVTINYRLSFLGSADLSVLEGYTDEYQDALNLTKLDQMQALKWVNENIEAWGGDKDNVTIMGHSSGSAGVNLLFADDQANNYFKRAIAASGIPSHVMISEETCRERSQQIFDILGVKSVEELTALTDDEIADKMTEINENVDLGGIVADGRIISKTWWDDLANGSAKDIDYMFGATSGEWDSYSLDWDNMPEAVTDYQPLLTREKERCAKSAGVYGTFDISQEDSVIENYLSLGEDKVKQMQDLANDLSGFYGQQLYAMNQCKWNENVYSYYWDYAPKNTDVMEFSGDSAEVSPWSRPLHGMDICFAFGTLEDGYTELTGDPEKLPDTLMPAMQASIYNFAKTGDPNNDQIGEWKKFNGEERNAMVISDNAEWKTQSSLRADEFNALKSIVPFGTETH